MGNNMITAMNSAVSTVSYEDDVCFTRQYEATLRAYLHISYGLLPKLT